MLVRKTRCSMHPWLLSQVSAGGLKILGLEGPKVSFQPGAIAFGNEQIIGVFVFHQVCCHVPSGCAGYRPSRAYR